MPENSCSSVCKMCGFFVPLPVDKFQENATQKRLTERRKTTAAQVGTAVVEGIVTCCNQIY